MDKTERIRQWLAETGRDGVVLTRRDNFTWASGAKNNVVGNTETGVASLVIGKDRVDLFADSSDLPRMEAEQNPLQAAVHLVPWYRSYDDAVREFLSSGRFASDTGIAGNGECRRRAGFPADGSYS
jgi:Xaa-Pro aminopeptidase